MTLNIAYMPNWGALWAIATAEAKGYFAEEGITLALTVFENGPTEIAAMESGEELVTSPEEPAGENAPATAPAQPVQPAVDTEELLTAIKALTATLQKSNIRASAQPAGGAATDPVEETRQKATEMLLNLCNT